MKTRLLLSAAIAVVCSVCPIRAQVDSDALKRRIVTLAAQIGRIDALAVACELRDDDWADDLETQFTMDIVLPDVGKLSTEDTAAESHFANTAIDRVKEIALAEFARVGAPAVCPGVKKDPALVRADKMVKIMRTPKDWGGAGGIK